MATATRNRAPGLALIAHDQTLGQRFVAGADEAGRGALAGPLVAAAVLLEPGALGADEQVLLARLNDSKKLSAGVRDELALAISSVAVRIAVVTIASTEIDEHGIQVANLGGLSRALDLLEVPEGAVLLVDGFALPMQVRAHRPLVKGDAISAAIAAASIIAKTTRDRVMEGLDVASPGYGFAAHAGYGTAVHREAISRLGPCHVHRYSFAPIAVAA
ncbi:MAG: ribonuclease HII [Thermoleophilia bacterium]|nr:ribonuclease HII [Thermoleophilia bacterium]